MFSVIGGLPHLSSVGFSGTFCVSFWDHCLVVVFVGVLGLFSLPCIRLETTKKPQHFPVMARGRATKMYSKAAISKVKCSTDVTDGNECSKRNVIWRPNALYKFRLYSNVDFSHVIQKACFFLTKD